MLSTTGFGVAFYKGTRPGLPGVYNRLVRCFENGPDSHCEVVFSNGDSASSSAMDGGVRTTGDAYGHWKINFSNGNWDFIRLPQRLEEFARAYSIEHDGWSYDYRGNVRFLWPYGNRHSYQKEFCSEFVLGALGVPEPWRFGVNPARAVCEWIGANDGR